jgi:acyl-CoA synthetase (AMP-forming)/AMP-acid ligase II
MNAELWPLLSERCLADSDAPVVFFRDTPFTGRELLSVLAGLRATLGEMRGTRVVLLLPDSFEAYCLHLLCFCEHAVIVPLSPQTPSSRIEAVCQRVDPDLVITTPALRRLHDGALRKQRVIEVVGSGAGPFELEGSAGAGVARLRAAESVRYVLFTSGSTGVPKGVCLGERTVLSAAGMMVDFLPVTRATRSCVTVPLYDYYGMIQIYGHLLGGGTLSFGHHAGLPARVLDAGARVACTDLVLVPHTLRSLLKLPRDKVAGAFKALSRMTSSSDILTGELLRELFAVAPHVTMVNIYGLTEAGRACYRRITASDPVSCSIGVPSKGVTAHVSGSRTDPGEIVLRGPNVMLGYLQSAEQGGLRFDPAHEMRTGDMGYVDDNGEIVLLGRKDHLINLAGMKIHPHEIETAAQAVPGVSDARAYVLRADGKPASIGLDIVASDDVSTDAVATTLQQSLLRPFVPTLIRRVAELPRTEIGSKLVR